MTESREISSQHRWREPVAVVVPLLALLWKIAIESEPSDFTATTIGYLTTWEIGPFVAWIAVFGLLFFGRRFHRRFESRQSMPAWMQNRQLAFTCCAIVGTANSAAYGWRVHLLPQLYHDEYAYDFQARTFLTGRLAMPALPADLAVCFDQPHLLTTPVFASRYFPGTAIWLLPFVALGLSFAANCVAAGLTAGFLARAGSRWSPGIGWLSGLLFATAPATVAFANLQLSPMPTMLAMTVFLDAYLASLELPNRRSAVVAGLAIAAAFLTRPLTAVGLGIPFAVHSLYRMWRSTQPMARSNIAWMIAAFSLGPMLLAGYNAALTGSPIRSPYDVYMTTRTPSHQFGFFNKTRGQAQRSPTVFVAYDDWSEDLTPDKVPGLLAKRWTGLLTWSLGLAPGMILLVLTILRLPGRNGKSWLLALGCAGLTAAYAPYWFEGLLGFSYLAEALPFLCLLVAETALGNPRQVGERPSILCLGLAVIAVALNLGVHIPKLFDPGSDLVAPRLDAADRERIANQFLEKSKGRPILLLIDADPAKSLHSTMVFNRPGLDGPVVRAWNIASAHERLFARFPNRDVYLLRPALDGRPATGSILRRAPK